MIFLKNKTAYRKWEKECNSGQPQAPIDAPNCFPCFAYLITASFGYEEERSMYLYHEDVQEMLNQLTA